MSETIWQAGFERRVPLRCLMSGKERVCWHGKRGNLPMKRWCANGERCSQKRRYWWLRWDDVWRSSESEVAGNWTWLDLALSVEQLETAVDVLSRCLEIQQERDPETVK